MVVAMAGILAVADAAPRDQVPLPDSEFLEFLGSWHTGDDRWVDPFQVDDAPGGKDRDYRRDGQLPDQQPERMRRPRSGNDAKPRETDSTLPGREMKP